MRISMWTKTLHMRKISALTWFMSLADAFAAAGQLFTQVLSSPLLLFAGPFAHPQVAQPISCHQQEGVVRVQTGCTGIDLKHIQLLTSSYKIKWQCPSCPLVQWAWHYLSYPGDRAQVPPYLEKAR